jgi:thiol-disulfide isomerase/thioredoxin
MIGKAAPEFPSLDKASWSGAPTSLASRRGHPVLINVWTFGCINCERTLPWVRAIDERYRQRGLAVIGVHSPEFERERDPKAVDAAREKHGLAYPSYLDNGHRYWDALGNHYWPAIYLVDPQGAGARPPVRRGPRRGRRGRAPARRDRVDAAARLGFQRAGADPPSRPTSDACWDSIPKDRAGTHDDRGAPSAGRTPSARMAA